VLLVLPFSALDARLALSLAKYLEHVGPYKSHEVLIATPKDCEAAANEIREVIGDQFSKVYTHFVNNHRDGWPIGCNLMFHDISYHIWTEVPCKAWYMFEPDNTPIKPNWLNTLSDEYDRVARPFMGVIHPSYWLRGRGTSQERFIQDGTHLIGTSIYPQNAPQYSTLWKSIPHATVPWDVYWQWEIVKHAAGTNLIDHQWRTIRYKRDKKTGEIKGERTPGSTLPYEPYPLRPDAVVHHGCKDLSLMNIMRGFFASRERWAETKAEPIGPQYPPNQAESEPEMESQLEPTV
jgi:hypothetical protein